MRAGDSALSHPWVQRLALAGATIFLALALSATGADAVSGELRDLIAEALRNNPELHAVEARAAGMAFRIPQARSLPDPMVMVGYQNEGYDRVTYGDAQGAQAMYSVSQMFPFPGKRGIRAAMARNEAEGAAALYQASRLNTAARVAELYYELFLAYKEIDLIHEKTSLFGRIEDAAVSRYSSGTAPQQDVLMAQTEKYMLLEQETMRTQKIRSLEAMLTSLLGRDTTAPLPKPAELDITSDYPYADEELIRMAVATSPEIQGLRKKREAAASGIRMAEREYYPDFTLTASLFERAGRFEDMWAVTVAVNVPLYYASRQRQALNEAREFTSEAERQLESAKLLIAARVRDNLSMVQASESLMSLYREGLIPKTYQDFELALSGYTTGRVEAITVVSRLRSLVDYETRYWGQAASREKAIAAIEAVTGRLVAGIPVETR